MTAGQDILSFVKKSQDLDQFRKENWVGTFRNYLDLVQQNPRITRNAYQRLYDMIVSYGTDQYEVSREKRTHYRFFDDPNSGGSDAVFGLERALEDLVNAFKSAACGYGIEKRVLLLHGPVGSSKSTIARLLKKGLEDYSHSDEGALYTLGWHDEETDEVYWCPMNEEPLHLVPDQFRDDVAGRLNANANSDFTVRIQGQLDPFCRHMYAERLKKYEGDWTRVMQDVRAQRILLSEQDRVGIGTFQPKDEKNQDSTELTGDINYRKIAEYGSDSDPRAFNTSTANSTSPIAALSNSSKY